MRSWLVSALGIFTLGGALLVSACGPASRTLPPPQAGLSGAQRAAQAAGMHLPPTDAATPSCNATPAKLPGTYTVLAAYGVVKGTTFTRDTKFGQSAYSVFLITQINPTPSPTPTPVKTPLYLWAGTFTSSGGSYVASGCFGLITTVSGKPLGGQKKDNAASAGEPKLIVPVHYKYVSAGFITKLQLTVTATGGHGTFSLDDGAHGTITLGKRYTVNASEAVDGLRILRSAGD